MRVFILTITAMAALAAGTLSFGPSLTYACAGLIGSNGAVNLGRTTTLAGYHDGVEHYVTAFQFQGGGGEFGALIPLPGVPTKVERGGAWTLQRLALETEPPVAEAAGQVAFSASKDAEVLLETRIDALDLTVLKGGGAAVATWAREHEFRLSPDAPEVLDFYAQRSPIFLAAVFNGEAAAARGQQLGDGTPVHLTIPTDNPWVPLRILALGKQPDERVEADVYLLTDDQPALLPAGHAELALAHSEAATSTLLDDLRSDDGMGWVPQDAWLTKLQVDSAAGDLGFDLAVDASGNGAPSPVAAGLRLPALPDAAPDGGFDWAVALPIIAVSVLALTMVAVAQGSRLGWRRS
ncbi:MAG: DUF2330 domain-containing protein [Dehalococcoidia bacterium]